MSTIATRMPEQIAQDVAVTFDEVFSLIDGWHDVLEGHLGGAGDPTAASLDPVVEALAVPAITGDGLLTGAGFVAAPGLLADATWHLAWWLASADGTRRLATVDDASSEQFRDYTALEWWRIPVRTGARHLTGPYVDYVCTDDYTVTITAPVVVDGGFLGVVGADLLVDRLEHGLLPLLRSLGVPAALVNASARVVTATDSRREPGSILRLDGLGDALAPLREAHPDGVDVTLPGGARVLSCGDTSLALVIGL